MKTSLMPLCGSALLVTAGILFTGCASTTATTVSPAAPAPAKAVVRVQGTVSRSDPDLKRFALATETRHRANTFTEQSLFDAVRVALEEKGYLYTSDVADADVAVFVNYGFSPSVTQAFGSRDLSIVERRVEVVRREGVPAGDPTVVTTTTTTTEPASADAVFTAYVDLVAYNQKSLKRDTLWETHIEGLSWSASEAHNLPRLVEASRNLISRTTNGTSRIELR